MEAIFISAILLGLASNFHCLGMCGPIAIAIPLDRSNNWTIFKGIIQYNSGRIATYSFLGLIMGSIGLSVESIGWLQVLSVVAGVTIILYAWRKLLPVGISNTLNFSFLQSFISRNMGKTLKKQSNYKLFLLGMLNGMLPCGMVFLALINALLSGNNLDSAMAMALFGTGTFPIMLFISFAVHSINPSLRLKFSRGVPYLLTIVGLLVVLRGLNLGIPYFSPKVDSLTTNIKNEKQHTIQAEMSCCHSKTACKK